MANCGGSKPPPYICIKPALHSQGGSFLLREQEFVIDLVGATGLAE